jgi:hypothetical protein
MDETPCQAGTWCTLFHSLYNAVELIWVQEKKYDEKHIIYIHRSYKQKCLRKLLWQVLAKVTPRS